MTPANRPEEEGAEPIAKDIEQQGFTIAEAHVDRAYVDSPVIAATMETGGGVLAKPWAQRPRRPDLFSKTDFRIDLHAGTMTCPAGQVELFEPGDTVHFDPEICGSCPLRANCTEAATGKGRSLSIAVDEAAQKIFRKLQTSRSGRAALRARVAVEHSLAHLAARKGSKARYLGTRRNLFDLRRAAAIQNLEARQRIDKEAA
ncbi:MAG TPA: transposase [Polyangiaceae bacterium]